MMLMSILIFIQRGIVLHNFQVYGIKNVREWLDLSLRHLKCSKLSCIGTSLALDENAEIDVCKTLCFDFRYGLFVTFTLLH